jgi:hypothetical protein
MRMSGGRGLPRATTRHAAADAPDGAGPSPVLRRPGRLSAVVGHVGWAQALLPATGECDDIHGRRPRR